MAITGHFNADFEKFKTAVEGALVTLKSFESGAGTVEKRLNSLADQFSGRRVISEATLMAEAVQRIGGASRLTEAELARVSAKAAEATAKMKAMGMEVPAGIAKLAGEYKSLDQQVTAVGTSMGKWIGSMVSAQAITGLLTTAMHGLVGVVQSFGAMVLQGAGVGDVEENFQRMTAAAGQVGDELLTTLRSATHNTISDFELMKSVNSDLATGLQLTREQFDLLGKGAFALAQATGGDVKTAFDAMNEALVTGQTRSLKALTGVIDLEAAETKLAASRGKSRDDLTEEGKLYAARTAIFDAVAAATKRLGDQTDGLDEKVAQAQTVWANLTDELGKTIANSPVLAAALKTLEGGLAEAFGGNQQSRIKAFAKFVNDAAIALIDWGKVGVQAAGFVAKEFIAGVKLIGNAAQIIDGNAVALKLAAEKVAQAGALMHVPGAQAEAERISGELSMIMTRMTERGAALKELDRMQAGVDKTTTGGIAILDQMKTSMIAARTETENWVGPLQAEAGAHTDAAKAADAQAASLDKLFKAATGKDIVDDFNKQLARMERGTQGGTTGAKLGLDPATQLTALYSMRAAEDALAAAVASELTVEKERKAFMAEYAKHRLDVSDQILAKEREVAGTVNDLVLKELNLRAQLNREIGLTVGGQRIDETQHPDVVRQQAVEDLNKQFETWTPGPAADKLFATMMEEINRRWSQASGVLIQNFQTTGATVATFGGAVQTATPPVQNLGAASQDTAAKMEGDVTSVGQWGAAPFGGAARSPSIAVPGLHPVFGSPVPGFTPPGGGGGTVTVNVSGVLDPRTINDIAAAVGKVLMSGSGRQFPNR